MNIRFGAVNNIRREDLRDPRPEESQLPVRPYADSVFETLQEELGKGLLEHFIMQSTTDRIELSATREVDERAPRLPQDDKFELHVKLDGQTFKSLPFRAVSYHNGYGNTTISRFNDSGIRHAAQQALKAVIDADKQARQA